MTDSTTAVLSSELEERARQIQGELPSGGLFAEKAWRISPEPFVLTKSEVKQLEKLGPLLHRFQQACDMIYRRSRKGSLPGWISGYLDQGKPGELIESTTVR